MKNFNHIYEEIYIKAKEPLEEIRKSELRKKLIFCTILIIAGIIVIKNPPLSIWFIPFALILTMIFFKNEYSYNEIFKKYVIKTLVTEYSENLNYSQYNGIVPSVYRDADFEFFDKYKSEDLIWGTLEDGCKFKMSDVHTQKKEVDENGNTSYRTLFRGLFAELEFNNYIAGKIKIRKNKIKILELVENIKMDSGEFEKIYDVYGTDKIITMQILTSDTMQMLIDFKEQYKIAAELTIKRNKLYIRFATGNMFESNLFDEALNYDTLKKYYDTINFTVEIAGRLLKNIKQTEI